MLSKAVMLAVVFVLIASPATYKLTSGLLGRWIATSAGCPTQNGVVLHAAVFVAVLFALWAWRKACSARRMYSGYDDDVETYTVGSKWKGIKDHNLTASNRILRRGTLRWQRFWDNNDRKWVWVNPTNTKIRRA